MSAPGEEGMDVDAAFQLIETVTNKKALFCEMCSLADSYQGNDTGEKAGSFNAADLFTVTYGGHHLVSDRGQNSQFLTPNLANYVLELVQLHTCQGQVSDETYQEKVDYFINIIEKSMEMGRFIPSLFLAMISESYLPLDLLWRLARCQAVGLEAYLASQIMKRSFQDHLTGSLVSFCQPGNTVCYFRKEALLGIFANMVMKSFTGKNSEQKKTYAKLIDSVIEALADMPVISTTPTLLFLPTDFCSYTVHVPLETLRKLSLHILSLLLSHKASASAEEVLCCQKDWENLKSHYIQREIMMQIFLVLECKDVMGVLENHLNRNVVEMTSLFSCASSLFIAFDETASGFQDLSRKLIFEGLEASDSQKMFGALLIVRMACMQGDKLFQSYQDWFFETFGNSSISPAQTKAQVAHLAKCLARLVPHERPEYLRAHVLKRPHMTLKVKEVYDDLVVLTKTRLVDLKIPLTEGFEGLYQESGAAMSTSGGPSISVTKPTDSVDQDVDKAVSSFTDSGRIPTALIEASIFKKPYFMGKFLPALLKPRLLPDALDMKMKLIDEVKKSGRIPAGMYSKYVEGCKKERQALLEGVFDIEEGDDGEEEMALPPLDRVRHRLQRWIDSVHTGDQKRVSENVIALCENIKESYKEEIPQSRHSREEQISQNEIMLFFDKDFLNTSLSDTISLDVLAYISRLSSIKNTSLNSITVINGVISLISEILKSCPYLKKSFFSKVLLCLFANKFTLISSGIAGSAVLCFALMKCVISKSSGVDVKGISDCLQAQINSVTSFPNLIEAVVGYLDCSQNLTRSNSLKFLCSYTLAALQYEEDHRRKSRLAEVMEVDPDGGKGLFLPDNVMKKTRALMARYQFHTKGDHLPEELREDVEHIQKSSLWGDLMTSNLETLEEWLVFEIHNFSSTSDYMSDEERMSYFMERVKEFIVMEKKERSIATVAKGIFIELVQYKIKQKSKKEQYGYKDNDGSDFVTLLLQLLYQLPLNKGNRPPWLASSLAAAESDLELNEMLSLTLALPPHLMLCDSTEDKVKGHTGQVLVGHCLRNIRHFATSSQNSGGFLSFEATLHILKAISCISGQCDEPVMYTLMTDPLVMMAVMLHNSNSEIKNLLKCAPQKWLLNSNKACDWAKRVASGQKLKEIDGDIDTVFRASVLIVQCCRRYEDLTKNVEMLKQITVQDFQMLLELFIGCITWQLRHQGIKLSVETKLASAMMSSRPECVTCLLRAPMSGLSNVSSDVRQSLGLSSSPQMQCLREFVVLSMTETLNFQDVCGKCESFTSSVITSYCKLLKSYYGNFEFSPKVSSDDLLTLSKVMRRVIQASSTRQLTGIDGNLLKETDPLLYILMIERRANTI